MIKLFVYVNVVIRLKFQKMNMIQQNNFYVENVLKFWNIVNKDIINYYYTMLI